jgi:hypothetical protein
MPEATPPPRIDWKSPPRELREWETWVPPTGEPAIGQHAGTILGAREHWAFDPSHVPVLFYTSKRTEHYCRTGDNERGVYASNHQHSLPVKDAATLQAKWDSVVAKREQERLGRVGT